MRHNHNWPTRLCRDVLMTICQRRCQNIYRHENALKRQRGLPIKQGRRPLVRLAEKEGAGPLAFVRTMQALPEENSMRLKPQANDTHSVQSQSTPNGSTAYSTPVASPSASLPEIQRSTLEIVRSAKERRSKMAPIAAINHGPTKRKRPELEVQPLIRPVPAATSAASSATPINSPGDWTFSLPNQ